MNKTEEINLITSYPKSGNTWLRFIIYLIYFHEANKELQSKMMDNSIPGLNKWSIAKIRENKHQFNPIFLKSHFSYNQVKKLNLGSIILVLRNPLDVLASLVRYYKIPEINIENTVNEFCKFHNLSFLSKNFNFPSWSEHLDGWEKSNQKILVLKYNDLLDNFDLNIEKIVKFLNKKIDENLIKTIKKKTDFETLKKLEKYEKEKAIDGYFFDLKKHNINFMSKGGTKTYMELFSDNQIEKLNSTFNKYITKYAL